MINPIYKPSWIGLLSLLLICSQGARAQTASPLNLEQCFVWAKQHYPLIRQHRLIEKTKEYSVANAQKAYLPQFHVSGQATYQSDVTQIPIALPDMPVPAISQDQYRLYAEVSQSLTNLFTVDDQQEYIRSESAVEAQKTEVELYKLRERVNNLYFGILLLDEQIEQSELLMKDIQNGIDQTIVAIANGVALKSAADNLKAELLKAEQGVIELKATRKAYAGMLALFTGKPVDEDTVFEKPLHQLPSSTAIQRPELRLFELQKSSFAIQNKLITAKNLPRVSLFFQSGLGRPGLNMLDNNLDGYYIGGLRLSWNISAFYTYKNEKKMLALRQDQVDLQKETFLFNTALSLKQHHAEITKMQDLLENDRNIIRLRESVKHSTQHQLKYGTATTNDYLLALNAENRARQKLILHEIQLLMAEYEAKTTSGNW